MAALLCQRYAAGEDYRPDDPLRADPLYGRSSEIPYPAFERISQCRLPIIGWLLWMRAAWLLGHGAFQESRAGVRARAARVVDEITAEGDGVNILLVGHAAFMQELSRELRRRGFKGPRFRRAANGQLYLFERQG
ncbi:broad specificity phosphatase PhoE [Paenibacillus mucilaginosus]|uniref:histidine phosphatase family protein n=1 Tax=Paenibacillus mucilaginosus TaxID=61624 RepID=UPI003D21DD2F